MFLVRNTFILCQFANVSSLLITFPSSHCSFFILIIYVNFVLISKPIPLTAPKNYPGINVTKEVKTTLKISKHTSYVYEIEEMVQSRIHTHTKTVDSILSPV